MLNLLNLATPITVNGVTYPNSTEAYEALKEHPGQLDIRIAGQGVDSVPSYEEVEKADSDYKDGAKYRVHVKKWMTEKSTPGFDLMLQLNGDVPMPMVIMEGTIIRQTAKLIEMDLQGIVGASVNCVKCGRQLTHPVSRLYGIGPECGGHFHIAPYATEEEFKLHEAEVAEKMQAVKWRGLIPKSSIKEMERA